MARLPFPDHVRQMLDEPNPAVIATLRADGQPVTVATWYLMDGERVLVNMDQGRKRLDHLWRDARVSALIEVERWHGWGDVRER